jgi:aerobic carbon-monoxide dehydrogenase medium subunit
VYPAAFEYHLATSLEDAIEVLEAHGSDAKVLSGGQSLIPLMKFRLVRPEVVVDINRLPGLGRIREDGDTIAIGALVRHCETERDPILARYFPWLIDVAHHVADTQVRSLGTVAGSLVEADPAGDWSAALLALDGSVRVTGPRGTRDIPCRDWFTYSFTPAIEDNEIVTEVRLPKPAAGHVGIYQKLEKRKGDFAVAGCALYAEPGSDGSHRNVRIGLIGVGPTPMLAPAAAARMTGQPWSPDVIAAAQDEVRQLVRPMADSRGSSGYKSEMAAVLLEQAAAALANHDGGGHAAA